MNRKPRPRTEKKQGLTALTTEQLAGVNGGLKDTFEKEEWLYRAAYKKFADQGPAALLVVDETGY